MKRGISAAIAVSLISFGAQGIQPAYAEATVYVEATSNDSIGRQLIYQVREEIRRSASIDLAPSGANAGYVINIVTLDPDRNTINQGNMTIYSYVFTSRALGGGSFILGHSVGSCGQKRLSECAHGILADTDEAITEVISSFTEVFSVKK